jgi:Leucine-rich repeat (LRR) protein
MTTEYLHQKLLEAYTISNLNNISLTLINLYKNQQYSILQKIADIISEVTQIEITNEGKGFSKFMMLYHPDRMNYHVNEIQRLALENNNERLLEYSHILMLAHIDEIANSLNGYEDIDYSPVYEWDTNTQGFTIVEKKRSEKNRITKNKTYNFYDAIKVRMYDSTEMEFPSYYLEDIDEFELASSDIDDLDGIEFCIHAKTMDLSDNKISDLSLLSGLSLLEELNLSDNEIVDIDVLSNLENLREVYLTNNNIDDISPLMNLPRLEFVDLNGTRVSEEQVADLKELGVTVEILKS